MPRCALGLLLDSELEPLPPRHCLKNIVQHVQKAGMGMEWKTAVHLEDRVLNKETLDMHVENRKSQEIR